jgi:hypothetical protein
LLFLDSDARHERIRSCQRKRCAASTEASPVLFQPQATTGG